MAHSWTPRNAGRAKLARIAMTAMTINNSINVNAEEVIIFFIGIGVASGRVIAVLPEEVNKYL